MRSRSRRSSDSLRTLGPPLSSAQIGKSSIALAVLYHDPIEEIFGGDRRFIHCDQFPASRAHFDLPDSPRSSVRGSVTLGNFVGKKSTPCCFRGGGDRSLRSIATFGNFQTDRRHDSENAEFTRIFLAVVLAAMNPDETKKLSILRDRSRLGERPSICRLRPSSGCRHDPSISGEGKKKTVPSFETALQVPSPHNWHERHCSGLNTHCPTYFAEETSATM